MSVSFVYITAADEEAAGRLARDLVERRLAACANILGPIRSIYWWEGAVQEERETALILKTRADLVPRLTERVREIHDYDCPCVVALPVEAGNAAFLGWVEEETGGPPSAG